LVQIELCGYMRITIEMLSPNLEGVMAIWVRFCCVHFILKPLIFLGGKLAILLTLEGDILDSSHPSACPVVCRQNLSADRISLRLDYKTLWIFFIYNEVVHLLLSFRYFVAFKEVITMQYASFRILVSLEQL
jgi:hypothetical protein